MDECIVWILSALLVVATVTIHYETIMLVSDRIVPWAQKHMHGRRVIAIAIAGLMMGHIIEIWMFALATLLAAHSPGLGALQGDVKNTWGDFLYLSAVNYTSLGDSTLRLTGPARALAASETLVGMMMIAWSASFTYLKMEQVWKNKI